MAVSLVATPASASANSFVLKARADAYFANNRTFGATWTAITDTDGKEMLLIQATNDINDAFGFFTYEPYLNGVNFKYLSALIWPWEYLYSASTTSAGSTTTAIDSGVAKKYLVGSFFLTNNAGSLYIDDPSNGGAAPTCELQAVSNFAPSTGTFTTAAFTAAVASGLNYYAFPPCPPWLIRATCEQALFISQDRQGTPEQWQRGISSESQREGASITYHDAGPLGRLCKVARMALEANAGIHIVGSRA